MARLTSRFLIDLLIRRTESAGGFATVTATGDAQAGTILVQCRDRDIRGPMLERRFTPTGDYVWEAVGPEDAEDSAAVHTYIERRRNADPDLWIIELDIANAPQLVADWALLA